MTITVVIGGLGSLTGSIIASTLITLLPELARSFAEFRMLAYGVIVVLIITLRPSGLMGYKEFSLKGIINWFRVLISRITHKKDQKPEKETV
jgi:branched-chain amino acid transport system permease protein